MKYMLLIYGSQDVAPQTPEDVQKVMDEYWAYEKAVADAGVRIASDALQGVEPATTIEVRDDGELFRADIEEVVVTGLNAEATMLVIETWTPGKGLRRVERK